MICLERERNFIDLLSEYRSTVNFWLPFSLSSYFSAFPKICCHGFPKARSIIPLGSPGKASLLEIFNHMRKTGIFCFHILTIKKSATSLVHFIWENLNANVARSPPTFMIDKPMNPGRKICSVQKDRSMLLAVIRTVAS